MTDLSRRDLLSGTTAIAGLTVLASSPAAADVPAGSDPFDYEVTRTDAEWRELLGDAYPILREGRTEERYSSDIWAEARQGTYTCAGCDLVHYTSRSKIALTKGWLFFRGSEPNAQLMSQDRGFMAMTDEDSINFSIEVHCRRCGSHTGHILLVEGSVLHCINGASLKFNQESV